MEKDLESGLEFALQKKKKIEMCKKENRKRGGNF
jgi:hypothetical protein